MLEIIYCEQGKLLTRVIGNVQWRKPSILLNKRTSLGRKNRRKAQANQRQLRMFYNIQTTTVRKVLMKYEYKILDSILLHNISLGNGREDLVPIPHQPQLLISNSVLVTPDNTTFAGHSELLVSNTVTHAPDNITSDGKLQYLDLDLPRNDNSVSNPATRFTSNGNLFPRKQHVQFKFER